MELIRNEDILYAARRTNLEISEISYGYLDSEWNMENLRASFTRVYLPLEGEGILTLDKGTVRLLPGNIYVVPSELKFSGFCPHRLNKIYIHLTLTRPDGSDLFAGIDDCIILPDSKSYISEIETLCHEKDIRSILRLKLLLHDILYEALTHRPPVHPKLKDYTPITKAALSYIDDHLSASLTIDEIANALFVSKLVLQKKFKADLDKSIGAYIDSCLMARAERLLLEPSLTVKEISERLGFCDQFYFSRKFSATHGISPRTFRKLHVI